MEPRPHYMQMQYLLAQRIGYHETNRPGCF